jgi:hypothetical protein
MGESKLKVLHVIIIGSFLCVAAVVGFYMGVVKPENEVLAGLQLRLQTANEKYGVNGANLKAAQAELEKAQQDIAKQKADYADRIARKMPVEQIKITDNPSLQRMNVLFARWKEHSAGLGPLLIRWPYKTKGITLQSSVSIDPPPINPNSLNKDMIAFKSQEFKVVGSYSAIMNQIRNWNNFPRFVEVSPVQLEGVSPFLVGTYNVKVYEFPQLDPGPTIPMAGGAGAASPSGGAGGPGGPNMMMPGGPPGMPGMPGGMPGPPPMPGGPRR